ncbi:MAG: Gfo/Idh/MocA family oxidoreductase [Anaerovoracaceae bacterium]
MKICFVGFGSIAKQHLENIRAILEGKGKKATFDLLRSSKNSNEISPAVNINKIYYQTSELPNDYDIIFITNPTSEHYDTLKNLHEHGKSFFIEKPVFMFPKLKEDLYFLSKDKIYYVAAPLRYSKVIEFIKKNVEIEDVLAVRAICSSYLPNWRPNQDYRKIYSAKKELGGGVKKDLIHELDYLTYIMGWPNKLDVNFGKISNLEIDSEDIAIYSGKFGKAFLELHLDYFSKFTRREVEIITKDELIIGDLVNNTVEYKCSNEILEFEQSREMMQQAELRHFLEILDGKIDNDNDLLHANKVLMLSEGIK